ncbi:MAG: CinA family protein [Parasporobacterium sp.]|nr:CinA family protein [Parasporobacterium sp.]
MNDDISLKFKGLTELLIRKNLTAATMESCTGGLIASMITDTEGSSSVFKGAYVTYCNEAKISSGVPADVIRSYGVYSPQTADEMAEACRKNLCADIGIGITGTFGNQDPVNADSVCGTVYFSISFHGKIYRFSLDMNTEPDRRSYKLKAAEHVCTGLMSILSILE